MHSSRKINQCVNSNSTLSGCITPGRKADASAEIIADDKHPNNQKPEELRSKIAVIVKTDNQKPNHGTNKQCGPDTQTPDR